MSFDRLKLQIRNSCTLFVVFNKNCGSLRNKTPRLQRLNSLFNWKIAAGSLVISGEDTLNAGEISRDLVAEVCVASLTDAKASNKVLEIIEDEGKAPEVFNGLKM